MYVPVSVRMCMQREMCELNFVIFIVFVGDEKYIERNLSRLDEIRKKYVFFF